MASTPSFLKDTKQVLWDSKKDVTVNSSTFLVTEDVASLYSNISHRYGMEAVSSYLKQSKEYSKYPEGIYFKVTRLYNEAKLLV